MLLFGKKKCLQKHPVTLLVHTLLFVVARAEVNGAKEKMLMNCDGGKV
jgi:hypothetical protein